MLARVEQLALARKVTPAQLVLAWVLAQGANIVPIPGTKRRSYLEQNAVASELTLNAEELARIDEAAPKGLQSAIVTPT